MPGGGVVRAAIGTARAALAGYADPTAAGAGADYVRSAVPVELPDPPHHQMAVSSYVQFRRQQGPAAAAAAAARSLMALL